MEHTKKFDTFTKFAEADAVQLESPEKEWLDQVYEKIETKMQWVSEKSKDKIPYLTINGTHDDRGDLSKEWRIDDGLNWWTNGFWGGMMWQLYQATKEPIYKEVAENLEKKMDSVLLDSSVMDHDSGFRWLPTAVANYRLFGSKESRNRGMIAASNLAGRYNAKGEYIVAWNSRPDHQVDGWAIIDCMMNLPLLYWAYEESGNPSFLHIAMNHADTAAKVFIRPDGSSRHIVEFDPVTGDCNGSYGGQGMSYGSSWTRGQGWALYGFTLSYMHTKKERYLETAERVADYFISCIPESGLIPVDFYQDPSCDWRDDTAGAIAACGLIELSKVTKNWKKQKYMDAAIRLLKAIDEKGCNYDPNVDELLEKCTAAYNEPDHNFPMIYADYYFIEAIWKLTGDELFIW